MVILTWCIIVTLVSQYFITILDYPRRRYNRGIVFTVNLKQEPFWFEVITAANQLLFWGCIGVGTLLFILNHI